MRIISSISSAISSLVAKLFFLLEFFLFLRLLLKFLGANPATPVVSLLYKYSDIVVYPFNSIFQNIFWKGHFVEIVTIATMAGYAVVVFILSRLLKVFSGD
ncbi:MAG: hypothetical protein V1756_01330 [Patescibacteria group bacterium]